MKIVFIYNGAENLGIEYISSYLKSKGHKVFLLYDPALFSGGLVPSNKLLSRAFSLDDRIVSKAVEYNPDMVAFSAHTGNYRWCLSIAARIKHLLNVPIVFGGVHPTAVPETVLANDFIDFAITGEGEFAMLDLITSLEKGPASEDLLNTPNICLRYQGRIIVNRPRPYIRDLDALPFPDKDLFYDKVPMLAKQYLIVTSRGCPYSCTYCSNNMYHKLYCEEKKHVRIRSPQNVIEELMHAKSQWNIQMVAFFDDVFTSSESWLAEFIPLYKLKINLPFSCNTNPMMISEKTTALLKEGGCWLVTMGIQSGSERIRREIFERFDSNERIVRAVSYIKSAGIKISVDNIFGAPSENEEDLKQSLILYNKIKPDRIFTLWLTYFPGTKINTIANLSDIDIKNINEGIIGFVRDTGSIKREQFGIYSKYRHCSTVTGIS